MRKTPPLRHTSDLQKTTSRLDTETTPHRSNTQNTNSTELSKHIWTLQEYNIDHFISWHILSWRSPYNSASKRCNLCFKEKLLIFHQPELSSLKKRNEVVYCVTIEQRIEIYHDIYLQIWIIGVDMHIIYIYSLWFTFAFMRITKIQEMKRWQKKEIIH